MIYMCGVDGKDDNITQDTKWRQKKMEMIKIANHCKLCLIDKGCLFDISDEDDLILVEKTQSVSEPSSSN